MKQSSRYETVNAVLGLMLIGLLFAPWEHIGLTTSVGSLVHGGDGVVGTSTFYTLPHDASGWNTHATLAVVLAVFGLALVAQRIVLSRTASPAIGLAWAVTLEWVGVVLCVWLLVEVLGGTDQWGAVAALATIVAILIVGWLGFADERGDRADAVRVPEQPIPDPAST